MKIRVADYKEGESKTLTFKCSATELDVLFDDMIFLEPIDIDGAVECEEKNLRYHGKLSARVKRICGRTLAEVEENWSTGFDLFFDISTVDFIEPASDFRELIILDHPMVFRAPEATKPVEYTDVEVKKKSPFENLKLLKKDALGSAQPHNKNNKGR